MGTRDKKERRKKFVSVKADFHDRSSCFLFFYTIAIDRSGQAEATRRGRRRACFRNRRVGSSRRKQGGEISSVEQRGAEHRSSGTGLERYLATITHRLLSAIRVPRIDSLAM